MNPRRLVALGLMAVVGTIIAAGVSPSAPGSVLRLLFLAGWLAAAAWVAWKSDTGDVESAVAVVFLIAFPTAFSGAAAGVPLLDQTWHAAGSISLVAFLYLFPRGQFEPRWSAVIAAASAAYLTGRAFAPEVAAWPGDLVLFPLITVVPLGLQVVRFRSASNAADRRRLQIVGLTTATALIGQLVVFGLLSAGWLGPAEDAEAIVEPTAYALALLLPLGVTLAMTPLTGRVRQLVDRLTVSGDDASELLGRLNALAQTSISSRDLIPIASEAVRTSLRLSAVSIDLDPSKAPVNGNQPVTAVQSWPLTYRGERLAALRVTPRPGAQLSVGDRRILDHLATQLAPLVGAVQLTAQLDDARSQLLNVREEERRRLRADLHDELGAALAGVTLKTGLAKALLDHSPEQTRHLLEEIESNLQTSVRRVRELVEGLRPAQLDELGLGAAIQEQADQLAAAGSRLELRVQGHVEPGLPAAVELAAYRIAQEALTNAVRHSGGSRVDVELAIDTREHQLTVRVSDDGVGLRDDELLGFGLRSMRQRAREVGGECAISRASKGGLVVTACLPLPEGAVDDRTG